MKLRTVLHEGVPEYFFSPHVTMIQAIHMTIQAWMQISMLNFFIHSSCSVAVLPLYVTEPSAIKRMWKLWFA